MPGKRYDRVKDVVHMTEVEGLKELQAELRKGGPLMAKKLQEVNKRLVMDVAEKARARMYTSVASVDSSHRPVVQPRSSGLGSLSRSKASIRGQAGQRDARVAAGGPKAPGFFGHEFGGGAKPSTRQFPIHRGIDGYFLYPVVREEMEHAGERWNQIFDEVFPENGGSE